MEKKKEENKAIIRNLNGFSVEKKSGIFHFVFPPSTNAADIIDALRSVHEHIIELIKKYNEKNNDKKA